MRNGILLIGMAFAVTLAIAVGNRLSDQAMAVVVGAVCGIVASIPVSIAFVMAASRNWGRDERDRDGRVDDRMRERLRADQSQLDPYPNPYRQPQPPVIVIAPPQQNSSPYFYPNSPNSPYYLPQPPNDDETNGRDFKIIGDE